MKSLIIALVITSSTLLNAQQMEDYKQIQEAVSKLFINTDTNNWDGVEAQFAVKVTLDYSSMTGNSAAELTPKDITTSRKTVLPGFANTHHQIGNIIIESKEREAHLFCYGTATHYLEDDNGNIWTVVGSYDFDLVKIDNLWKISSMTFNYKYQDGNTALVTKAIENVKND